MRITKSLHLLIRWAIPEDKPTCQQLAAEVESLFGHPTMEMNPAFIAYMDGKIALFEALIAIFLRGVSMMEYGYREQYPY